MKMEKIIELYNSGIRKATITREGLLELMSEATSTFFSSTPHVHPLEPGQVGELHGIKFFIDEPATPEVEDLVDQLIDIQALGAQGMVDNFSEMILGVANAEQLTQQQKDYIIEMLEDQLNIELETAQAQKDRE